MPECPPRNSPQQRESVRGCRKHSKGVPGRAAAQILSAPFLYIKKGFVLWKRLLLERIQVQFPQKSVTKSFPPKTLTNSFKLFPPGTDCCQIKRREKKETLCASPPPPP